MFLMKIEIQKLNNKAFEQIIYVHMETFYLAFCYKKMFAEIVLNYICTLKMWDFKKLCIKVKSKKMMPNRHIGNVKSLFIQLLPTFYNQMNLI